MPEMEPDSIDRAKGKKAGWIILDLSRGLWDNGTLSD